MSLRPDNYEAAKKAYKPMRRSALRSRSSLKRHKALERAGTERAASAEASGADNASERQQSRRRQPIRRAGKKVKAWADVRRELKIRFEQAGVVLCERGLWGCFRNNHLGFAHCKKRRKIQGAEIWHVALICNNCHDQYETMPHEQMESKIHELIDRRGLLAPPYVVETYEAAQKRKAE